MQPNQPPPPHVDAGLHALTRRAISDSLDTTPAAPSPPPCWNVNLPKLPTDHPPVGICCVPLSRDPGHIRYDHRREPDGTERLSYTGIYRQRPVTPETDVAAVFAGQIAISRLKA